MSSDALLTLRPFDPGRDYPGVVELISAANLHDEGQDWYPTVESLANEWAPRAGFDPTRDAIVVDGDAEGGDAIVAVGTTDWRERAGKIIHSSAIWVHPGV
ncbi:MAG: hypothetical protein ABIR64_08025, partial [Candidatus Limnocylindrales bacterium]